MINPRLAPGSGDRSRLATRTAVIAAAAAILLVLGAYAVSRVIGPSDGLTAPTARSDNGQVASPTHPAPSDAPPASGDTWLISAPQPRAVPAVPSPAAGAGGPRGVYGGPFGTQRRTGASYVALTFDDGPDPRWTPQVLDLLRTHGVRATFCVRGQAVEAHPELVRAIVDDGHTLCNHTWDHDMTLGQRSRDEIRRDLRRTTAAIHAAAPGTPVSYYRQPGGFWTQRVVEVAAELGMTSVHWDVDPRDWSLPGVDVIVAEVTTQTQPGSIVLLHDGDGDRLDGTSDRQQTVEALAQILPELTGRLRLDALPPPG
jgi:peptidoglycan/xylan/chitin deacetylase (PgdA/CDA1 family)